MEREKEEKDDKIGRRGGREEGDERERERIEPVVGR